jgi:hypothetical protein
MGLLRYQFAQVLLIALVLWKTYKSFAERIEKVTGSQGGRVGAIRAMRSCNSSGNETLNIAVPQEEIGHRSPCRLRPKQVQGILACLSLEPKSTGNCALFLSEPFLNREIGRLISRTAHPDI